MRKTVVIVRNNQEAEVTTIPDTIGVIEQLVGGYAEELILNEFKDAELENVYVVCNEEGFLNQLPINRIFNKNIVIRGTFLVLKKHSTSVVSLNEDEIKKVLSIMNMQ